MDQTADRMFGSLCLIAGNVLVIMGHEMLGLLALGVATTLLVKVMLRNRRNRLDKGQ